MALHVIRDSQGRVEKYLTEKEFQKYKENKGCFKYIVLAVLILGAVGFFKELLHDKKKFLYLCKEVSKRYNKCQTSKTLQARNRQYKESGNAAGTDGNNQGIAEHLRKVQDIPVCKQFDIVLQCVGLREKCIDIGSRFSTETGKNDPYDRHDPDKGQQCKQ